jgi:hypothetical protein
MDRSNAMRVWGFILGMAICMAAVLPARALTQSGSSAIAGIVRDGSGAVIPGAQITVVNDDTGVTLDSYTNLEGSYRVGSLVPGRYRVTVTLAGFNPTVRQVAVEVGQTVAVDLTLDVAGQTEAVTVVAGAPLIDTQTSTIGQVVSREMLAALPLPNRAASSLVSLAPGVVMIDPGVGTAENYPIFSVAGGRARNQNFILDGGNASNAVGLTRPQQLTTLPVDAMQEFKVITNNYSAEYGHSTGGVITMSTRSGTNQLRGTAFHSLQNDALNAPNFFATIKPPMRLNQFGGTLGGPIRRTRSFYFGSWERTRQLTSEPILSTVPTLRNRAGDFSDLVDSSGHAIVIYDPATRQPFPGNIIPSSRIDPVAMAALKYFPEPNLPGTTTNANNHVGVSGSSLDRDILVGRVDHRLGSNDLLTVRYYLNNSGTVVTGSYTDPAADPLSDTTSVRIQSLTGAHTHILSSSVVNEMRVTYLRRKFIDQHPGLGSNLAGAIGLIGVSDRALPVFNIPGYGATVATSGSAAGQSATAALGSATVSRFQTPILDTQLIDSLSWSRGRHAYKFGVEFRAGANNETRDRGSSGILSFSPLITSNLGAANTGNALAAFLLGEVNAGSVQISDMIQTRASYLALYAQDDWRLTSRLTINYGLRWEAEFPRREINNRMNSFDPLAINPVSGTPGVVTFAGRDGTPERAFRTDLNNLGPRVGFAYQLNESGRTVVRGGTGIFYGPTVSNSIGDVASLGFSTSANFVVAQATTESAFRLRDGFPAYSRPALTPAFGAVAAGQRPNTAVGFFDPNQVAPISYQTNFDVQHQLAPGLMIEGGFISNQSRHLTANDFSINQVPTELMGPGNTQSLRPFPQFSNVTLINPSIGRSSYYAGFVRVQKRFADGFSILAHYTRSRYFDDAESSNEYGSSGSYMDAYHRELDWAASASDVPNQLVVTALYEVQPFSRNRYTDAILANWRIGVLHTMMSGPPFTVVTSANTTNAFPAGPLRADLIANPELPSGERTLTRWFNTSAFVNPAPFTFGNAPRSVLRGPGRVTTDLTLEKSVGLPKGKRIDVRVETYNLFNRANFNIPGATLGAANFGVISSAQPARIMQIGTRFSF